MLSLGVRAEVVPALSARGGMTSSIFPEVEAVLLERRKYREAILRLRRVPRHRYQSVVDLVFCELHPEWKKKCYGFYRAPAPKAEPLSTLLSASEIETYTTRLFYALEIAYEASKGEGKRKRRSWAWLRREVDRVSAQPHSP